MRTPRRLPLLAALASTGAVLLSPGTPAAAAPERPERLPDGVTLGERAPAAPEGITAASWLVADLDSGEVLAARDPHAPLAPASTQKVLTALALLPVVPPEQAVMPTQAEVDVEGSKVGLLPGVHYPAEELYRSLLMVSGNDAANALAGAAGGQGTAAALMNAAAAELGALDTHAVNPHGLDAPGQQSTAYDLAVISRAALAEPRIAGWVATRRSTMSGGPAAPRFEISNKNKLLPSYEGALGVKNGYTTRAQASFVGAAERDGRRLVVTLMRAEPKVWAEAGRLLDWGFAALAAGAKPVGALPALPETVPEPAPVKAAAATPAAAEGGIGWPELPAVPVRPVAGVLLVLAATAAVRPGRRREPVTA